MKLKPYMQVRVDCGNYTYVGETMSFPTPEGTIMVRRVPGHPGTLEEVAVAKLSDPIGGKRVKVHYATVKSLFPNLRSTFPIDMLRYDGAAPVNFRLVENDDGGWVIERDESMGLEGLWIATSTPRGRTAWCPARWRSFGWSIKEERSEVLA